jgi:hypothetical protein
MNPLRAAAFTVFLVSWGAAATARAEGTYFLVELNTGVGESAYTTGNVGLNYGLSIGTSFKFKALPLRFYVLASLIGRNASTAGSHEGVPFVAERIDLDLYGAFRTVLPIWSMLRIYAEFGAGNRFIFNSIRRGEELGTVGARDYALLFVIALGLQARLSDHFSVGLRGELTPLGKADLASYVADVAPTQNRLSAFAQLGIHF